MTVVIYENRDLKVPMGAWIYCKGQRVWVETDATGRGTCPGCGLVVAVVR